MQSIGSYNQHKHLALFGKWTEIEIEIEIEIKFEFEHEIEIERESPIICFNFVIYENFKSSIIGFLFIPDSRQLRFSQSIKRMQLFTLNLKFPHCNSSSVIKWRSIYLTKWVEDLQPPPPPTMQNETSA